MTRPDLDPAVAAIIAKSAEQHRLDADKLRAAIDDDREQRDEFDDLLPTPLDAIIAGLVAIVAVGIGVAAVIGAIRIFGG